MPAWIGVLRQAQPALLSSPRQPIHLAPTSADAAVVDQLLLDALVGTVLPAQFLTQALIARAAAKRSQRGDEALDLLFSRCHLFFLWLQAGQ